MMTENIKIDFENKIDLKKIETNSPYILKNQCLQFDNPLTEFFINNLVLFWITLILVYEITKNLSEYLTNKILWKIHNNQKIK